MDKSTVKIHDQCFWCLLPRYFHLIRKHLWHAWLSHQNFKLIYWSIKHPSNIKEYLSGQKLLLRLTIFLNESQMPQKHCKSTPHGIFDCFSNKKHNPSVSFKLSFILILIIIIFILFLLLFIFFVGWLLFILRLLLFVFRFGLIILFRSLILFCAKKPWRKWNKLDLIIFQIMISMCI